MFNVGGPEVLVILLVALIALGPAQLPQAARKVGQVMTEIRKVSTNFQRELTSAFEVEEQKEKAKDRPPVKDRAQAEKPTSAGGPTDLSTSADEVDDDDTVDDEPVAADDTVESVDDTVETDS